MRVRALEYLESEPETAEAASWKARIEASAGLGSGLLKQWLGIAKAAPTVGGLLLIGFALLAAIGWAIDWEQLGGAYLGAPAAPVVSALLMAQLGLAILLLRARSEDQEVPDPRAALAGRLIAGFTGLAAFTFILNEVGEGLDIGWAVDGPWASPSLALLILVTAFSLGLVTLDRDPPRHLWSLVLEPVLGVMVLSVLLSHGYQINAVLDPSVQQEISFTSAIGMVLLFVCFLCLRPQRGLVGFVLSEGPGPSMARYLVPTAIVLPALIGTGEYVAAQFGEKQRAFGQGGGEILLLVVLLGVIAFSSQRLQRYYSRWRDATSVLAEQADVLRGMSEGVAVIRVSDSRIVLTNPQFDTLHGYSRGDLIGSHIEDMTPEDLSTEEATERTRVTHELVGTGSARYESRSITRDGSEIWCRCTAVLSRHENHGSVLILVKTDITQEHLARIASREAEIRFRQVFEQSPIGLCLVNEDGGFAHVNAAFEKITGYTSDELYEMSFADITYPDDLELDHKLSSAMFAGDTDGFEMEKRYVRKDGEIVWIYLTSRMLRNAEGVTSQALSMVEDITERHELSRQLQHLADHDPLTGLYNRRRFEDELGAAIGNRETESKGLAILNIDLDNFKFINDTYGHSVGDQLIIRTAELLKQRLRAKDTLARQGGDEFVVVLRDIDREGALQVARELSELVASDVRVDGPDYSARVTASIGVAYASPEQDIGEQALMIHADVAMYEVKDSGRNGARLYDPREESQIGRSLDWVEKIRWALANDGFVLYAQPIASFTDGPVHHELFIRLKDRDGTIVAPGAFLPIAERHDLIQEIDQWVIRRAIAILASHSNGGPPPRLCVNLSGGTVGEPGLLEMIAGELDRTGADPSGLIFEVTETSAIGNIAGAQTFAARLAELGCRFALDDFGTGFASFYYLKHITCDYVKIDGEFVRQIANDPTDRLLVRALVEISKGMGKLTIAEHVEDAETLELLREYGVDFAQGYHVGHPLPIEEIDLNSMPGTLGLGRST